MQTTPEPKPTVSADISGSTGSRRDPADIFAEPLSQPGSDQRRAILRSSTRTPWLTIQPDPQYVIRPDSTGDPSNAIFVGGRVPIVFKTLSFVGQKGRHGEEVRPGRPMARALQPQDLYCSFPKPNSPAEAKSFDKGKLWPHPPPDVYPQLHH